MWLKRTMTRVPIDDTYRELIISTIGELVEDSTAGDYSGIVTTIADDYLHSLQFLGCHLIGKYPLNDDGELMDITSYVVSITKLSAYRHLAALTQLYKTNEKFILENGDLRKTNTAISNGTTRAATEESPITAAPINSAPTESTEWDLENPHSRAGSQYDSNGTSTDVIKDPNLAIKAAEFNMRTNIYSVITSMIDCLVDEKMSVH